MFNICKILKDVYLDQKFQHKNNLGLVSKCCNKISFWVEENIMFVFDLRKEKYVFLKTKYNEDETNNIIYKNKHIGVRDQYDEIEIFCNINIYDKKPDYSVYEDKLRKNKIMNYGYENNLCYCPKTKFIFFCARLFGGVSLIKIYKITQYDDMFLDVEYKNTVQMEIKENITSIEKFDYKKNILIVECYRKDEKFIGEIKLFVDLKEKIEIINLVKYTDRKNYYYEDRESIFRKKYKYIFYKYGENICYEKNNNDKFFRINKINRYNKKIKKIVKYMLINEKYENYIIEDLLTKLLKQKF